MTTTADAGRARVTTSPDPEDDRIEVVPDRARDGRWLILAGFVAVVAVTMWRHEMWRDELQAWMIARASDSVPDLLDNLRYEGHPALWYVVLLPLSKLHDGPWMMQLAQLVIATASLALVLWKAPFTLRQKALFAFGYFVVFEYGALSRSYSLGFLLVSATCVVASGRRRWPWSGVTLALLALTSAFGALVAAALLLGLVVDEVVRRRLHAPARSLASVGAGLVVALAGFAVAYQQASPPGDAGVYKSWKTSFDFPLARAVLAAISRALVPVPQFRREFWNTSIFDGVTALAAVAGVVALVGIAWLLRRRPGACAVWVGGVALVIGFLYTKIQFGSASRHYGHVFIALTAALWLVPAMATIGREHASTARARSRVWTAVLVAQVVAGLFVVAVDLRHPFSNGRDVASLIDDRGLDDAIIVGDPDLSASTVAAYLGKRIYYTQGERFGEYILWDDRRTDRDEPVSELLRRLNERSDEPVLFVSNRPRDLRVPGENGFRLEAIAAFDDGIIVDEHLWVYRVVGLDG
jgi:hypothetical protein